MIDAVVCLIIPIIVGFVLRCVRRENDRGVEFNSEGSYTMRLPKMFFWIGIIDIIIFVATIIFLSLYPTQISVPWVFVFFSMFVFLGLCIVFTQRYWAIHLFDDHMVYVSALGKKDSFKYTEIISVQSTLNALVIKTGNKNFKIDDNVVGTHTFRKILEKNNIKTSTAEIGTDGSCVLRLAKGNYWGGMCIALVGLGFGIFLSLDSSIKDWSFGAMVGGIFLTIGIYIMLQQTNFAIYLYEDHIVFITSFKNKFNVKYTDINEVQITRKLLILKTKKKTFRIDGTTLGIELLMKKIEENNISVKR